MRHQKAGKKLNRTSSHRKALLKNLAAALIREERIRTTDAKAKALRPVAEKLVTLAREGSLAARRRAFDRLRDREAVQKLFGELAPRFENRPGGYTRIVRIGDRTGDAAPMSVIEWVAEDAKPKKAKKAPAKGAKAAKTASA